MSICIFYLSKHVFLCVPTNSTSLSRGQCTSLVPRYCGPFEILKRVASPLALPYNVGIHLVFHINRLKLFLDSGYNTITTNDNTNKSGRRLVCLGTGSVEASRLSNWFGLDKAKPVKSKSNRCRFLAGRGEWWFSNEGNWSKLSFFICSRSVSLTESPWIFELGSEV